MSILNALNIEGWKAVLFVGKGLNELDDAPEDMDANDDKVLRREQWIVAGDQYLFVSRLLPGDEWSRVELGEYEMRDVGPDIEPFEIDTLQELVPILAWRLAMGEPDSDIHPVLRTLVSDLDIEAAQWERSRLIAKDEAPDGE